MTRYPRSGKGRRWTTLELKAVPTDWKGDTLADGDGLSGEVRVATDGAVSIAFRYAFKWEGKVSWYYCGAWPLAGMDAIRAERDRARALVKEGVKPTDAKRAARIEAQAKIEATIAEAAQRDAENLMWREMFADWLANGVQRADGNAELRRSFEKDLLPALGTVPVRLVTEADLRDALRRVGREREAGRMAEQLTSAVRQLYRWAEKRKPWRALMIEGNPAELLETRQIVPLGYEPGVSERVLSPSEIRELHDTLQKMEAAYSAAPAGKKYSTPRPLKKTTQLALWISLGTACRIGELLKARWEHVDLAAGEWIVPKRNTKTRIEWRVFLSPFALRQFKELHSITGESDWCFPARVAKSEEADTHVCEKSVSKQVGDRQMQFMDRKGPLTHRRNDNTLVLAEGKSGNWSPHDMRRTAATMMQELGVLPDIIDRCQNHAIPGDDRARKLQRVRKHYLHYDYAKEKREAWDRLGQRLDAILPAAKDAAPKPAPVEADLQTE